MAALDPGGRMSSVRSRRSTALTDAQRRGLDAATQVVRGFADLLDMQPPPDTQPSSDQADDGGPVNGYEPGPGSAPCHRGAGARFVRRSRPELVRGLRRSHGPDAAVPRCGTRFRTWRALDASGRRGRSGERNGVDAQHDGAAGFGRTAPHRPRLPRRANGVGLSRPLPTGGTDDRAERQYVGNGGGGSRRRRARRVPRVRPGPRAAGRRPARPLARAR